MDYKALFAVGILLLLLLLTVNIILFLWNRKLRLEYANKQNIILEQLDQIEKLNKEIVNLSDLNVKSMESSNKRTEFYSNIIHEMKTPLSVILGALQLIDRKHGGQPEEEGILLRNLRVIRHNCYRLLRLSNNLLDLAKMEAGYLKLRLVNCEIDALLEEIVQSVLPYAEQMQLDLQYIKPPSSIMTAVDKEKLERIILNLLSNSIKFTKPGGKICVSTALTADRVCITVEDTGVGIPVEMQEEIFKRYIQSGNHPKAENEGCGIGLSLVKSFVDLHHGNIRIVSEKGCGSKFTIELPLMHVNDAEENPGMDNSHPRIAEAVSLEFTGLQTIAS